VQCINFEIEVRNLRAQVLNAKHQDAQDSLISEQLKEEMEEYRKIVLELQEECDGVYENVIRPLEGEVNQIELMLQDELNKRDELRLEEEMLKVEIEDFVVAVLEMESAVEQMNIYHTDVQTMFHNLRMNLEQNRYDIDKENLVLRRITNQQKRAQHELDALEKKEKVLMQKCTDAKMQTEQIKNVAQQAASENDALHDKLIEANENRRMWSVGQSFLERMAIDTRISMQSEWAAGVGGRRRSSESKHMSRDAKTVRSAELPCRRNSVESWQISKESGAKGSEMGRRSSVTLPLAKRSEMGNRRSSLTLPFGRPKDMW